MRKVIIEGGVAKKKKKLEFLRCAGGAESFHYKLVNSTLPVLGRIHRQPPPSLSSSNLSLQLSCHRCFCAPTTLEEITGI